MRISQTSLAALPPPSTPFEGPRLAMQTTVACKLPKGTEPTDLAWNWPLAGYTVTAVPKTGEHASDTRAGGLGAESAVRNAVSAKPRVEVLTDPAARDGR